MWEEQQAIRVALFSALREQDDTMLYRMLMMTFADLPSTHRPGRHPVGKQRVGAVGPRIPVCLEIH
jgi:hypothetical protein